jgi:hypothetical protein
MGSMEVIPGSAVGACCSALDFIAGGKWGGCLLEDLDGPDLHFVRRQASSPNIHRLIGAILKQRYRARHGHPAVRRTSGYSR